MWKNIWPLLILGAVAYAYYTGWDPLAGMAHPTQMSPGTQAGGPAVVREVQQAPLMMQDMAADGSGAGSAQAAGAAARRALGKK
jgi:hypothetical protein